MAFASFTYNGTDTVTAHITGATVGHTITVYVQDDDCASNESIVAPSSAFDFVYPCAVGCTPPASRFAFAWDASDGDKVIGTTVFDIDSGSSRQHTQPVTWDYDGANTITATLYTAAGDSIGLDVSIGDFNEFSNANSVSPGGVFQTQIVLGGAPSTQFFANVYRYTGSPYDVWGTRMFTPGVAGSGSAGNPASSLSQVVVVLDEVDVTSFCVSGSWTRRLNRPSQAQVRINMQSASAPVGSTLKIEALVGTTWEIVHHGRVLLCETDAGEDTGYTVYNSTDPMELWQWRPVRAWDGDFSKPEIENLAYPGTGGTTLTGPSMIQAMLENTEGDSTAQGNQLITPPSQAEGPTFLTFGSFDTGGVELTGAPVDWPMTIAQLTSLLVSTGEVDVVITPTDPGGGIMGTVDGYNGDYGNDLSASVLFQYGMGAYNVARLRQNEDMTSMVNKLWYYAGPRIKTAADPAMDQHWCFNVTGDDPAFNPDGNATGAWALATGYVADDLATNGGVTYICKLANSSVAANEPGVGTIWRDYWVVSMTPPGGRSSPPASATDNDLGVLRIASQGSYGVRMDIQIFDAYDDNCTPGFGTPGHDMYRRLWQVESWLRAQPRELIHITPTRGTEIGTFDIGDLVTVEAVAAVRGGFSGVQRVYEYTVSWDQDGVLALSELQTSPNNEGI